MSAQVEPIVDAGALRDRVRVRVREMYRDVARRPGGDFHFETGRALAESRVEAATTAHRLGLAATSAPGDGGSG